MRRALAPLLLFVAAACAAPVQSGGVDVRAGAEQRLEQLCKFRRGESGRDGCASGAPAPARVVRVADPAKDALRGALAIARPGDYVLDNGEIAVAIDALGRGSGFAESGGNVIDAADARVRVDELGQMFTFFGVFPRQAVYERLATGPTNDGAAFVDVAGHELYEAKLAVRTRYLLRPGSRALEVTTELENEGERPLDPIDLGDAVQWGSAIKLAP
ncbi:MAG TPA: hypothetical protein VHB21_27845, partial [Minicystis sp.]|nr:hypothetical protein [Minicystis sp.]